jgi:hypothetical protein
MISNIKAMQKIALLIDPYQIAKARTHLNTFQEGSFVCHAVFMINIPKQEIKTAVHAFEYILAGIDFHFMPLREF